MRILKLIRYKLLPGSHTKFLQKIYKEMSSSQRGELTIRSWELKAYVQALMFCLTAFFQAQLSIILSTAAYVKSYCTSVMPVVYVRYISCVIHNIGKHAMEVGS